MFTFYVLIPCDMTAALFYSVSNFKCAEFWFSCVSWAWFVCNSNNKRIDWTYYLPFDTPSISIYSHTSCKVSLIEVKQEELSWIFIIWLQLQQIERLKNQNSFNPEKNCWEVDVTDFRLWYSSLRNVKWSMARMMSSSTESSI